MAPSNFEQYYAIKKATNKDFKQGLACQHEWSEEQIKNFLQECWETARKSFKENIYIDPDNEDEDDKDEIIEKLKEKVEHYEDVLDDINSMSSCV